MTTPACLVLKPGTSWLKRRSKLLTNGAKLLLRLTTPPRVALSSELALTNSQNLASSAEPPANTTSPEPGALGMYIKSLPE